MPRPSRDLTNQQFGKLTALSRVENKNGRAWWKCQCECGETKEIPAYALTSGNSKSCGCARETNPRFRNRKHGHRAKKGNGQRSSKEYRCWLYVKALDSCPPEWREDFTQFLNDVGNAPSDEHLLTRKDNRIPHSSTNVYWTKYGENIYGSEHEQTSLDMRNL